MSSTSTWMVRFATVVSLRGKVCPRVCEKNNNAVWVRCVNGTPKLLRSHEGKEDGFANPQTGERHQEPIDSHAHAAGRWHSVLHRTQKVFVELHGVGITLGRQQRLRDQPLTLN